MARQIPGMANPRGTAAVVAGLHTSGDREQLGSCPGPHDRADQIDLPVDAQNRHIWTASDLIGIQPTSAHNGIPGYPFNRRTLCSIIRTRFRYHVAEVFG
jgi:hypothetical protein